jgi:tRNA U55 pseudouridine synthase TruB
LFLLQVELGTLLEKAGQEMKAVQELHRERMGKFEADCALQLELREEEQEAQLQALAQQHEAKMAKQEAVSFHCLESIGVEASLAFISRNETKRNAIRNISYQTNQLASKWVQEAARIEAAYEQAHPTGPTVAQLQQEHEASLRAAEQRHEVRFFLGLFPGPGPGLLLLLLLLLLPVSASVYTAMKYL